MSADNWRECPNCDVRKAIHEMSLLEALTESYGVDTQEQYEVKKLALAEYEAKELEITLREDYGFNFDTDSMELDISYKCSCEVCGFNFSHNETVLVPSGPEK